MKSALSLYLVRHGNMAGDPHRHFTPPVETGCLSDVGEQQAARLAAAMADFPLTHVYASPLGRALQTAAALAAPHALSVGVIPWLEEWRPAHVLQGGDAANFEAMAQAAALLRPEQTWKTEAGESLAQMVDRIVPGFQSLMAGHRIEPGHGGWLASEAEPGLAIALVGHGGSLNVLLKYLLGVPMQPGHTFAFEETGVARLNLTAAAGVWGYFSLGLPPPVPEKSA